jgi:hypothetical protein
MSSCSSFGSFAIKILILSQMMLLEKLVDHTSPRHKTPIHPIPVDSLGVDHAGNELNTTKKIEERNVSE